MQSLIIYVLQLKGNGEQHPILIAAGGGGLGLGQFVDTGHQHGRGPAPSGKLSTSSTVSSSEAGE